MSVHLAGIIGLVVIFALGTLRPINLGALALATTFVVGSLAGREAPAITWLVYSLFAARACHHSWHTVEPRYSAMLDGGRAPVLSSSVRSSACRGP